MKASIIASVVVAGALMIHGGCTRPPRSLSPLQAAQLAARLANDECERRFQARPFKPEQHVAVTKADRYRWGGLDEGAPRGLSALVTFAGDGSDPKVEVYYSTDSLRPAPLPPAIPFLEGTQRLQRPIY